MRYSALLRPRRSREKKAKGKKNSRQEYCLSRESRKPNFQRYRHANARPIAREAKYRRPDDLGRFITLKMIPRPAGIYGFYRTLIQDNRIIALGHTPNPEAASVECRAIIAAGNGASFCHRRSSRWCVS